MAGPTGEFIGLLRLVADPSPGTATGRIHYNTSDGKIKLDTGTAIVSVSPISLLDADGSPDLDADFIKTFDDDVGDHKKVSLATLLSTIIISNIAEATSTITRSLATYAVASGMTITPGAGTYAVFFSSSLSVSLTTRKALVSIFSNGVQVSASEREIGGTANHITGVATYAEVTVSAGQAIDVRWKLDATTGGPTATMLERTLYLIRTA